MGVEEGKSNGGSMECEKEVECLKSESNGFGFGNSTDIAKGSSGASEGVRTYKRRRQARFSWDSKSQDGGGADVESSSQLANQRLKEPVGTDIHSNSCEQVHVQMNSSDACSERNCTEAVLENMYQSLGDDEGGVQVCIREALAHFREIDHTTRVKESGDHEDRHRCCFLTQSILNGSQKAASMNAGVVSNGFSNKSNHHTVTAMCQCAFYNVLVSETFTSLCKVLLQNFQGIKADSVFDFSLINSRMKGGDYEHSPMLFSNDMQQASDFDSEMIWYMKILIPSLGIFMSEKDSVNVRKYQKTICTSEVWRKLQVIGTDLISLARNLSDMSRASYNEQFYHLGSDPDAKLEQTEDCGVHSACTCRCCGCHANGKDCLVCDSCEEMYHISCIEPAVKEIPPSWYCSRCTASGIGSPHENCVVCEKLNVAKTVVDGVGGESVSTEEETINETGENSKWSADDGIQLSEESKTICKTCGLEVKNNDSLRTCGHPYCPKKYYHVRCLTTNQLRSYGPCWYCYSCLCRNCLIDKDDDMIVLCDGCDHGYHLYCMEPPRTSIPAGKWFCKKCDTGIKAIRKARKAYDKKEKTQRANCEGLKKLKEKGDDRESEQGRGGMEVLLCAVHTLDNEE
ncbi:hypothetical protein ACFX2C_017270 [Malus domestica]